ncbi:MAG: ABC transporter permease [Sphingobacteriia bacterium]
MRKLWLIIGREYRTRVFTRVFLFSTLGMPVLLAGLVFLPILVTEKSDDGAYTVFVRQELPLAHLLAEHGHERFTFISVPDDQRALARRIRALPNSIGIYAMGAPNLKHPHVAYYRHGQPGAATLGELKQTLNELYKEEKLVAAGVPRSQLAQTELDLSFGGTRLSEAGEEAGNQGLGYAVGYAMALLNYILLIIYGLMVMRGVMEEKINRIVEVVISSVRPFQLMLGKLLGIGAVGLTQFAIWGVLLACLLIIGGGMLAVGGGMPGTPELATQLAAAPDGREAQVVRQMLALIDAKLLLLFGFFFLTGFLLYGSLFAALGSAADQESDSQNLSGFVMLPIMLPLLFLGAIINDPHGTLAVSMSLIPLFAPVAMMARYAGADVPAWQLLLSMGLMLASVWGSVWLSARVYRVGMLMYGKKPSLREILRWARG